MNIEVNGIRGLYEVTGEGPPLVLLATPVARAKTYRPTVTSLARTFRVYTVELPGCGWADSIGSWSVDQYAGWVVGFVTALGLTRPVIVGHSQSGPIGVVLAARYPDSVGRLVLVDAMGTGPHSPVRVFTVGMIDLILEFEIVPARVHHVLGNLFLHPRNFLRQAHDALTLDVRAEAAQVKVPTLVAWGARSLAFPQRHASEYARCLPDARLYLSPRGCHNWMIARPDEFAAEVAAFVQKTTR